MSAHHAPTPIHPRSPSQRLKDLPRVLGRLKAAKAGAGDWAALAQSVQAAGMARDTLHALLSTVRVSEGGGAPPPPPPPTPIMGGGGLLRGGTGPPPRAAPPPLAPHPGDPLSPATPYSAGSPFLLRQVLTEVGPAVGLLHTTLDAVIDWGATPPGGRLAVRPGLDARLDGYRRTYADLPDFLSEVRGGRAAPEAAAAHTAWA